ncbi:MAG: uracil-DNA glycosylase [Candidatus Binatia bacterium]|nr:uracil-DNA glycosylase [Candidatus Binatia bacterium]
MDTRNPRHLLLQITTSLRHYLESLQEEGVTGLPVASQQKPPASLDMGARQGRVQESELPKQEAPAATAAQPPRSSSASKAPLRAPQPLLSQTGDLFFSPPVHAAQTLEELRAQMGDCQRCKLCRGRTHIVFGVGNPRAELVFVGEAPGRDEDLRGEPFVGRAGQLLTEIITKGMKMRREDVYITNVVKCRPPENRNPEPDEIAACEPFLVKQLELIRPRIIVALGTFAAQTLLKSKTPISRLRGIWHSYQGIKLMPTLHPAYLLRNPQDKRLVWQDIQAVLRDMGRL